MKYWQEILIKPWLILDFLILLSLFPINIIYLLLWRVRFAFPIFSFGMPIIRRARGSKIILGKNMEIRNGTWANVIGVDHPTCLATRSNEAEIVVGENVGISGGAIVAAKSIKIGNNVLIGANCLIVDNDFHPISPLDRRFAISGIGVKPVVIEDNVFIGADSIILKGTHIGKNTVIGAGSVVSGNIPANSIAYGNPASVRSLIH